MRLQSRCYPGIQCVLSEGLTEAEWSIHFQDGSLIWLFAGGLSSLSHQPFPRATWVPSQHGNPRENNPKESKKERTVFYDLHSEVTFHRFHNILLGTQVSLPKDMNTRKQVPGRQSWKAGYHNWIKSFCLWFTDKSLSNWSKLVRQVRYRIELEARQTNCKTRTFNYDIILPPSFTWP